MEDRMKDTGVDSQGKRRERKVAQARSMYMTSFSLFRITCLFSSLYTDISLFLSIYLSIQVRTFSLFHAKRQTAFSLEKTLMSRDDISLSFSLSHLVLLVFVSNYVHAFRRRE